MAKSGRNHQVLADWASVCIKVGCLAGFASSSPIAEQRLAMPKYQGVGTRLPPGLIIHGYKNYLLVEKALTELPATYKGLLALDQGLLRPDGVDLKTPEKRARFAEISTSRYFQILAAIDAKISEVSRVPLAEAV